MPLFTPHDSKQLWSFIHVWRMGHVGHVSKKHGILLHGFTTSTTSSFIQTTRKITRSNLRGHEVIFADTLNICHWKRMEKDYRSHGHYHSIYNLNHTSNFPKKPSAHHWKKIKKTQFQASSVLSFFLLLESHLFQLTISLNTLKRWQDFDYLFRLHAKQSVPLRFFSPPKKYSDKSQTANTAVV